MFLRCEGTVYMSENPSDVELFEKHHPAFL
jgi:hypothetical protein